LKLGQMIGRGGEGTVYRGTYSGRAVAIKRLHQWREIGSDGPSKELRVLSKLRHVHVLTLYGYSRDYNTNAGAQEFLISELAAASLESLLPTLQGRSSSSSGTLELKIALQVAEACAFLHSKGVIHRDLKSANVLSMHDKLRISNLDLKLCDFGLARQDLRFSDDLTAGDNEGAPTKIKSQPRAQVTKGAIAMSFDTCAPELIGLSGNRNSKKDKAAYTSAVDVYAYAHLLWAVWEGTSKDPGLAGKSTAVALNMICHEQYRPRIHTSCPEKVVALIRSGWAEDPLQRPTFSQICLALRGLLRDVTIPVARCIESGEIITQHVL
jgi:serine/threonine protein kinase